MALYVNLCFNYKYDWTFQAENTTLDFADVTNSRFKDVPYHNITAVILAGGRGSRLGGVDKGLEYLSGRPMITYILDTLKPQCGTIIINANRNIAQYRIYGYPVISDEYGEFAGPLAGFLRALQSSDTHYVLCVPCDAPLLPENLTERLWQALVRNNSLASVACNIEGLQPVYTLLTKPLISQLQTYLESGERKAGDWLRSVSAAETDCSDCPQMFLNMNTEVDRVHLMQYMQKVATC